MGHNHVVLGNPKFIGNPNVDRLSMGPLDYMCHSMVSELRYTITCRLLGMGLGYGVVV